MSEVNLAGLCKGSTADSDSVCEGSNPSPAAIILRCPGMGRCFDPSPLAGGALDDADK